MFHRYMELREDVMLLFNCESLLLFALKESYCILNTCSSYIVVKPKLNQFFKILHEIL